MTTPRRVFHALSTSNSSSSLAAMNYHQHCEEDDLSADTTALLHDHRQQRRDDSTESEMYLRLRIRPSVVQLSECEVTVKALSTVGALRECIKCKYGIDDERQSLRLVYAGKLVTPDSALIANFQIKPDSVVHAIIGPKATVATRPSTQRSAPNATAEGSGPATTLESTASTPTGPPRGLDVLMHSFDNQQQQLQSQQMLPFAPSVALTADQVLAIRTHFEENISQYQSQHMTRGAEESETDFRFRAETEWMSRQGPRSEFRMNLTALRTVMSASRLFALINGSARSAIRNNGNALRDSANVNDSEENEDAEDDDEDSDRQQAIHSIRRAMWAVDTAEQGTSKDFAYGLIVGYWLGFLMVFCVWDRHVPYTQKLGLIVGVLLNLSTDMLYRRWYAVSSDGHNSHTADTSTLQPQPIVGTPQARHLMAFLRGSDS